MSYLRENLLLKAIRLRDKLFKFSPIVVDKIRYDKNPVGPYYMPWWHDPDFLKIYRAAESIERGHYLGMSVAPRAYVLIKAVESVSALPEGDLVECGVFRGGTALLASEVISQLPESRRPTFHLFDTFQGIPGEGLTQSE